MIRKLVCLGLVLGLLGGPLLMAARAASRRSSPRSSRTHATRRHRSRKHRGARAQSHRAHHPRHRAGVAPRR
ncbi:MAG TPA: hypothetical protein VKI41_12805 [Vicinamibacteria bacterium]|nr:hypothetical protein [Vicinamibacteria bacterium]